MKELLQFLLGCLATYRLSLMVSKEAGPGFIFRKLRRMPPPKSATKEGLSCQLCLSVWFAAPIAGFYVWRGWITGWEWPLYWLAFSAVAIVIHMHTTTEI